MKSIILFAQGGLVGLLIVVVVLGVNYLRTGYVL